MGPFIQPRYSVRGVVQINSVVFHLKSCSNKGIICGMNSRETGEKRPLPWVENGYIEHAPRLSDRATRHSRPQSLRSFWPAAGIESSGSNHFEITKEITEFCPSGLTQPSSMAHARNGCSQSSRFLPQARRIEGSGDKNGHAQCSQYVTKIKPFTRTGNIDKPRLGLPAHYAMWFVHNNSNQPIVHS